MVIAIEPFASTGSGLVHEAPRGEIYQVVGNTPVRSPVGRKILKKAEEMHGLPSQSPGPLAEYSHGRTELERYWQKGGFRPPYLWSALKVLREADVPVACDPVGGGFKRGPHNCGTCDKEIVVAINEYSLTADKSVLDDVWEIPCPCKKEWEFVLANERSWNLPLTQ